MSHPARQYGPVTALAFVIGTVVGTGIYLKPAQVARLAPELWQNLCLWVTGGLFATAGALVYARLAEVWPQSGGAYVYLRNCYGERVGSLLLAADILLGRPAAVGALATGLGLIWGLTSISTLLLALATLTTLTLGQWLGRRATGRLQLALTVLQMVPFLVIVGAGLGLPPAPPTPQEVAPTALWASGFLAVLWAYDGWYNITILGGEVERPEVNLRRALVGGMLTVTVFYVGLNALLLTKVSRLTVMEEGVPFVLLLRGWGLESWTIGLKVALSLALLSTLNGILACGPSMLAAGGLGDISADRERRRATLLFSGWCGSLLLLFSLFPSRFALFDQMSEYTACVVAGLSGLTVTCLFHLPARGHAVGIGTRWAAVGFLVIDLTLVLRLAYERPALAAGGALSVLLAGVCLHWYRQRALLSAGQESEDENP